MLGPYPKPKKAPRIFHRPEPKVKNMSYYPSLISAIDAVIRDMKTGSALVPAGFWQSVDVSTKPEMATYEIRNVVFAVLIGDLTKEDVASQTKCNMPWAEDHFAERVGGEPINPGVQWAKWPYGNSADKFRDALGQFNHNYMERYWPRYAALTPTGDLPSFEDLPDFAVPNMGIRGQLGDLYDVVELFVRDPLTRQAYVPIFFPEDTGNVNGGRVPCTLGYHLMRRNDKLHINYYIRSCDLVRHFRDDIYLTVRLLQWVLDQLKIRDSSNWHDVSCGEFSMFISSLHMFRNDWQAVFNETPPSHIGGINEYSRTYRKRLEQLGGDGLRKLRDQDLAEPAGGSSVLHREVGGSVEDCPADPGIGADDGRTAVQGKAYPVGYSASGGAITGRWRNDDLPQDEGEAPEQDGDSSGSRQLDGQES